ncbi:hypothetical protein GH714_026893 [Hevea brasiliensis]|uniref:Uncharacterized protein n=1 Tax=Hevea brasiliensis TaxID=3981 RepID=A0A6A6K6Y2_HEVBR|nr:hypothetical protein GH714_026893 [Hevea brasiliensis]
MSTKKKDLVRFKNCNIGLIIGSEISDRKVPFEGTLDSTHGRHKVVPCPNIRVREDFVPISRYRILPRGRKANIGLDPLIGEILAFGDVGNDFVWHHDGDYDVGVLEGIKDIWVGIVDFDAFGSERFDELH